MSALWALDINDRWHYANDEHGGYPESELCDQTQAAIATLRTALAQQAAQPVELAALVAERDDALALAASRRADWDSMRQQWVKVRAERDSLRQDAERYRWMRDKNSGYVYSTAYLHGVSASKDTGCDIFSVEEVPTLLDAEIDRRRNYNAAMGEQK